ncbi:DUF7619 domain-containing protein [Flavobacterium hydrophilum]|uniref:T9SS C-terminal target domain-containing protein n=1 Tax=Flavobacterium hydrophilum TaxID=2211445 RepID=A0A2V4C828_9FLAO|nr:T9SS type A sorting domain-containing protein [Flavobacterium hydrophilum]PXY47225.1 T9SS C-terminal target domain-containing protein [Flavobacterium hydrophilum]
MKKIYFLFFVFYFFNGLSAQIINFPDANFKTFLLKNFDCAKDAQGYYTKIDKNEDGEIQEKEALEVVELNVYQQGVPDSEKISSLEGILKFTNLKVLNCSYNKLEILDISGLTKLEKLNCISNKLSSLDLRGLTKLQSLECSYNQFTSLDINFLINLQVLDIGSNHFTSINLNLINLLDLRCAGNKFTALDLNGLTNLQYLNCSGNQLQLLKFNGLSKLKYLDCENNKFTTLDLSSLTNLKKLYCGYNFELTNLFIKNGSVEDLTWRSLMPNPKLKYICGDEFEMENLKNILILNDSQALAISRMYGSTYYQVSSYCSFTPGGIFYAVNGNTKFDTNSDGCDFSDKTFPNLKFSITNGVISSNLISNTSGAYSIYVQTGTHTLTPVIENPDYFSVFPSAVAVSFPSVGTPFVQNFCVTPNGVHPDLEISLLPIDVSRPGFDAKYKIVYKNKGNKTQTGSINIKFDDTILDYVSSSTAFSNQTSGNLEWNFINLQPFESKEIIFTMNVNSPMETPAVNNGDILKLTATIVSQATDETLIDNTFTLNQTVVGSYDPNDKTCLEGSIITPSLIGEYVHYMIRFENTGTYQAQSIVVKDMIDLSKFDISTLIPTSSSHSFVTKISEGNKVEFIFENINLPFDDANNDGYVAFKIKTLPTLKVGDSFTNEANIYFDYNFPILTNKATSKFQTTLSNPDFEFSNYFALYPNPVSDVLNINAKQAIEIQSLAIYDILGQLVIAVPNAKSVSSIDVSKLRAGTYFLKVKSDKGSSGMKFIKN